MQFTVVKNLMGFRSGEKIDRNKYIQRREIASPFRTTFVRFIGTDQSSRTGWAFDFEG